MHQECASRPFFARTRGGGAKSRQFSAPDISRRALGALLLPPTKWNQNTNLEP